MRVSTRRVAWFAFLLLTFLSLPAHSQNLLVNPGFDRDLSGWTVTNTIFPDPSPQPGYVEAFAGWVANDRAGSSSSGGASFHAGAFTMSFATSSASQCVPLPAGTAVSFGAQILTARQYVTATAEASVTFFAAATCSGSALASASASSLTTSVLPQESNSGGLWLPAAGLAVVPAGARSVRFAVGARATGTMAYGLAYVDAVADDAYVTAASDTLTTSLLPSAGWVPGAGGAFWRTALTLVNPGAADAAVTLKWLGHDTDGRNGSERAYLVSAGQTLLLNDEEWELNHPQNYGATLVTSSSPTVFLQSETSTPAASGGTVGQALPALGPSDFAGALPKTLAPIRENASFRTNLVLANPTQISVAAHVVLFAEDGTQVGSRDVDLPPLGMTQLTRVAALIGAPTLDLGRISVSTPTPGGLVAAYASIIDNVTNDPRTLLPQDTQVEARGPNPLVNPGFDRGLTGWSVRKNAPGNGDSAGAGWQSSDIAKSPGSGSADLFASTQGFGGYAAVWVSQCVAAVVPGRTYSLQAWVQTRGSVFFGSIPSPELWEQFFTSGDCSGNPTVTSTSAQLRPFNGALGSGTDWFALFTPGTIAPADARSALVSLVTGVSSQIHGLSLSASFDDVLFAEGDSAWTWFLPAAASVYGNGGSHWTTDLSLSNTGDDDASVYLEYLDDCSTCSQRVVNVPAGRSISLQDVLVTLFERSSSWGALRFTTTSPSIAITSETSTPTAGGGTVGQALAAIGPHDLIGATQRSIAPVRDDGAFRTNLVVLNATELPLTAHVELFDGSGLLIGSQDILLGPLAMAQINGVGWSLAEASVNPGRISVSTPTPGGLLAAYASVIDNKTNDPRTLLPR